MNDEIRDIRKRLEAAQRVERATEKSERFARELEARGANRVTAEDLEKAIAERVRDRSAPKHRHREAFAIMKYASADGSIVDWIWNSRDGVTPFCCAARDGVTELRHVEWGRDRYEPRHVPEVGDRIFVTMTHQRAIELYTQVAEKYWDHPERPMRETEFHGIGKPTTKLEAALYLALVNWRDGQPDVVEVTEERRKAIIQSRSNEGMVMLREGSPGSGRFA